jgi:hypothetical protein
MVILNVLDLEQEHTQIILQKEVLFIRIYKRLACFGISTSLNTSQYIHLKFSVLSQTLRNKIFLSLPQKKYYELSLSTIYLIIHNNLFYFGSAEKLTIHTYTVDN